MGDGGTLELPAKQNKSFSLKNERLPAIAEALPDEIIIDLESSFGKPPESFDSAILSFEKNKAPKTTKQSDKQHKHDKDCGHLNPTDGIDVMSANNQPLADSVDFFRPPVKTDTEAHVHDKSCGHLNPTDGIDSMPINNQPLADSVDFFRPPVKTDTEAHVHDKSCGHLNPTDGIDSMPINNQPLADSVDFFRPPVKTDTEAHVHDKSCGHLNPTDGIDSMPINNQPLADSVDFFRPPVKTNTEAPPNKEIDTTPKNSPKVSDEINHIPFANLTKEEAKETSIIESTRLDPITLSELVSALRANPSDFDAEIAKYESEKVTEKIYLDTNKKEEQANTYKQKLEEATTDLNHNNTDAEVIEHAKLDPTTLAELVSVLKANQSEFDAEIAKYESEKVTEKIYLDTNKKEEQANTYKQKLEEATTDLNDNNTDAGISRFERDPLDVNESSSNSAVAEDQEQANINATETNNNSPKELANEQTIIKQELSTSIIETENALNNSDDAKVTEDYDDRYLARDISNSEDADKQVFDSQTLASEAAPGDIVLKKVFSDYTDDSAIDIQSTTLTDEWVEVDAINHTSLPINLAIGEDAQLSLEEQPLNPNKISNTEDAEVDLLYSAQVDLADKSTVTNPLSKDFQDDLQNIYIEDESSTEEISNLHDIETQREEINDDLGLDAELRIESNTSNLSAKVNSLKEMANYIMSLPKNLKSGKLLKQVILVAILKQKINQEAPQQTSTLELRSIAKAIVEKLTDDSKYTQNQKQLLTFKVRRLLKYLITNRKNLKEREALFLLLLLMLWQQWKKFTNLNRKGSKSGGYNLQEFPTEEYQDPEDSENELLKIIKLINKEEDTNLDGL